MLPRKAPKRKKSSDDKSTKDKVKKKDDLHKKSTVNENPKSQKNEKLLPKTKQEKIKQWCVPKRTVTSDNTDNSSFTQATNASSVNPGSNSKDISDNTGITGCTQAINDSIVNQSISKDTVDNTDISSFTQATNASIVNLGSTSTDISDNTGITGCTRASNDSIVNQSISKDTVDNTDISSFTQATNASIVNTSSSIAEMELCMDPESALFGITTSTEVTNRSTINSQLGSASVSVDIHGERDKDIHVERNQSTESEDNHEDTVYLFIPSTSYSRASGMHCTYQAREYDVLPAVPVTEWNWKIRRPPTTSTSQCPLRPWDWWLIYIPSVLLLFSMI